MAEACPHLRRPTPRALESLRDPLSWNCAACSSTDGVWCCLTCGHVGCGRRAHLPALGGGHSRHHYQTAHAARQREQQRQQQQQQPTSATGDDKNDAAREGGGNHEVCLDVLSKAVHCYECDDYVLSDAPWLAELRSEIEAVEGTSASSMDVVDGDYDEAAYETAMEEEEAEAGQGVPGRTGLHNLGNTCFMNSVLQILSHCSGFRSFFRDFLRAAAPLRLGETAMITRQSTIRHLAATTTSETPDTLALTEATHALLRVLWNGRWTTVAPRAFVQAVWTHAGGLFAARRQQDAQEFLNFVLNRLDEEINYSSSSASSPPPAAMQPQQGGGGKPPPLTLSPPPPPAISPILKDMFGVDQYQEVTCDGCRTRTVMTEPLLGLVLSLPDEDSGTTSASGDFTTVGAGGRPIHPGHGHGPVTLSSCLDTIRSTERLSGVDRFYCDTCQDKRDATKTVTLRHGPQALLLSFRRTRWSPRKGLHKDKRRVIFPLELDATSIFGGERGGNGPTPSVGGDGDSGDRVDRAMATDEEGSGDENDNNGTDTGNCFLYELSGIVSHSGSSPFCGHYIAWCRVSGGDGGGDDRARSSRRKWLLFNDALVTEATEEDVLKAEAFILLYERRSCNNNSTVSSPNFKNQSSG